MKLSDAEWKHLFKHGFAVSSFDYLSDAQLRFVYDFCNGNVCKDMPNEMRQSILKIHWAPSCSQDDSNEDLPALVNIVMKYANGEKDLDYVKTMYCI